MDNRDTHNTAVRISEEEARKLWQRAAELQAAAERRNTRSLPAVRDGLSLAQIAHAAEGAGIDPDYVRLAIAEKTLPDADRIDRDLWSARWLRAILREPDAIEASQYVDAEPTQVHAALRNVAARPSFELIHEATIGEGVSDAVLVYRLGSDKSGFQDNMNWTDARVFLFTIRSEADGARIRVRVPLYRRGINLALTGGLTTLFASGGMTAGAATSGFLPAALSAGAIAALPVAVGAVAGAVVGVSAYRAFYRSVFRSGEASVMRLLQAIAMEAKAES